MKKILFLILIVVCVFVKYTNVVCADNNYKIYNGREYKAKNNDKEVTKYLFIVDFSNSMNEKIGPKTKLEMAIETIQELLTELPKETEIGLRVYGQRTGVTYVDGCMASKLMVPIEKNNKTNIEGALYSTKAVGWTPITYSLKQAVHYDFVGFKGKKKIILLTDGGENCDESPCTWAIGLMRIRNDISIDVIAFDIFDVEANNQLKCTALTTSGKFHSATTQAELRKSLFDSMNVDKDVKGEIKIK